MRCANITLDSHVVTWPSALCHYPPVEYDVVVHPTRLSNTMPPLRMLPLICFFDAEYIQ